MMRISPHRTPAPEQIAAAIIAVTAAAVLAYRYSPLGAAGAHRPELPPLPPSPCRRILAHSHRTPPNPCLH